ncbi:uncharacterized protein NECHADRAFT_46205 [Fusarium vanettenii 77-13-4]|uniref:BZIP domain-containing protein n=1 Tax=Fusarium vanettenii (strain ATCC MYA-4622 / CBS 123669 / FGSC 9596 / NRRL 45880 / 77-13-4) TaxID=660122 RepID=C7Z3Q2_FUSV7|nr:uncharacterized protein NECHADRAFT_46205 [Fusarium vanettenii 77-13-4]EEU41350.1 hypothetical protein NECHADRAFT_46205 [Fusarium vanettenii 77-13-4]
MEPQTGATTPSVSISEPLPVQIELLNPDDWSGITSSAERRRRQNRVNQRTWPVTDEVGPARQIALADRAEHLAVTNRAVILAQGYLLLPTADRRAKARLFTSSAYNDYRSGVPQPGYLPALTHLNVLDAMARNAAVIGFSIEGLCRDDLISPFNTHGPGLPWAGEIAAACPATLLPTPVQQTIIHHPWVDLFPIPRFRDNVLLAVAAGVLDEDELCADMLSLDNGRGENASLIVWAGSWDPRGWEASIPFLRKWGWLLTDCRELCLATNEWRDRRGEKRLVF